MQAITQDSKQINHQNKNKHKAMRIYKSHNNKTKNRETTNHTHILQATQQETKTKHKTNKNKAQHCSSFRRNKVHTAQVSQDIAQVLEVKSIENKQLHYSSSFRSRKCIITYNFFHFKPELYSVFHLNSSCVHLFPSKLELCQLFRSLSWAV